MATIKWIPEAPKYPGLYAVGDARLRDDRKNCTTNVHEAIAFDTKEECAAWCAEHPEPVFSPVEHAFDSRP